MYNSCQYLKYSLEEVFIVYVFFLLNIIDASVHYDSLSFYYLPDGSSCVAVLHVQIDRASRYSILRSTKEATSDIISSRVPSCTDAHNCMDRRKIYPWWSSDSTRFYKFIYSYSNVHVLHAFGCRTLDTEISLVEKVLDITPARSIFHYLCTKFHHNVFRLQFPQSTGCSFNDQLVSLPLFVRLVLCEKLPKDNG